MAVDFVEVVAEACLANAAARREAIALRALWPVVVHGVKLSLAIFAHRSSASTSRSRGRARRTSAT
jgi:uncharacterized protein (UPF0276 family)